MPVNDYDPNYVPTNNLFLVAQKAIVLNKEKKILVLLRSEESGAGGKWSLPGGGLEFGEEPFASIQREILEETQLNVSEIKPFHVKSYISSRNEFAVIIGFACNANSDTVVLNWEHNNHKWLAKDEIFDLDITPDCRTFVEKYIPS